MLTGILTSIHQFSINKLLLKYFINEDYVHIVECKEIEIKTRMSITSSKFVIFILLYFMSFTDFGRVRRIHVSIFEYVNISNRLAWGQKSPGWIFFKLAKKYNLVLFLKPSQTLLIFSIIIIFSNFIITFFSHEKIYLFMKIASRVF